MPEMEKMTSKDRVQEITDKLEQGIKELFEGEKFKNYLNTMSKFHNYSFNNTMLIAMQKPDATLVAGFNSWKNKFERNVNKGEKGIHIFAPAPYTIKKEQTKIDEDTQLPVLDKDGKPVKEEVEIKVPAFKVVSVFDVSQTSGKELPTLGVDELKGEVKDYEKFFEALKEVSPVPIRFEKIEGTAKGYFDKAENIIAINEDMSEVQTVKTAIHEIAHAKLHNLDLKKNDLEQPKDHNTEEVEAESVAYTVCQHFGIDTSDYSFAYVATWGSGKELPELKSSLETIRATANDLINGISDNLLGKEKEQEQTVSLPDKENKNIIGNTAYSEIQDKQYFRLTSKTAEKVAAALTEQNVSFSGRINGDKTTLTIGKADVEKYKAIIAEVTGKEKKEPEKSSKWRMYVIPDLKTWADNGKTAPQTPIEYYDTFKEAKARFDELRNQPYNAEKAMANGSPAARLTLGIDSEKHKSALDILHVRDNQNCLVDDFTRNKPILENKEAMGLIKQTAKEIGFDVAMVYKKLDNDRYANEPDMIPFDKWDNPYFKETKTVDKSNIIGNTAYKDIANKTFKKLPTEKALAVAKILESENTSFSGRVDGDKTTITISKADNEKFKAALKQIDGQEKAVVPVAEQPKINHFDIPLYLKAFEDAQKENKVDVFRESNKENMECCKAINEAISENYHYPNFDSKSAFEQVFKEFPLERIEHVVAARISIADWDKRYSDKTHKWAKDLVTELPDKVKERFPYYSINEHPGLVNLFAEQIMDKQLEIRQEADKAVAEDVQREFDEMEKKFDGEMPDNSITIKDMRDYGYEYSGMLPLRTDAALELFDKDLTDVHLLYDDGTEVTAEARSEIEKHSGIFGVETDDWSKALRVIQHDRKLEREEAGKEAIVLFGKDDAFGIYQLKNIPENREVSFMPLCYLEDKGMQPNRDSYTMVYSSKADLADVSNISEFLESVFVKFNTDHPKDFEGHSLSVGDVVVVKMDGQLSAHYVDDVGFKELAQFGEVKNHLKAIEDTIEQNDNSFDGIINNTPTADELEKKAMNGEQISLLDLAKAVQKDKERKPEEKRSIRAYLKQAQGQKQPENKAAQKQKGMEL